MKYLALCFLSIMSVGLLSEGRRGPHHPSSSKRRREAIERGDQEVLVHDKSHIEKDAKKILSKEQLEQMTDEQLEFYYFSLHDFDGNSKLDGLEILKAIYHADDEDTEVHEDATSCSDIDRCTYLVDNTLKMEDGDNDGYISYFEYYEGKKRMIKEDEMESENSTTVPVSH